MVKLNKIDELIKNKKENPLKRVLYDKVRGSVDVNKYLRNNDISRDDIGSLEVNSLKDVLNFGKMGANNYTHDLSEFIKDPSSILEVIAELKRNPDDPTNLTKRRLDQAKAGTSGSVLLAALLSKLMSDSNEEDYSESYDY